LRVNIGNMMNCKNCSRIVISAMNKGSINIARKASKRWYLLIFDSASV